MTESKIAAPGRGPATPPALRVLPNPVHPIDLAVVVDRPRPPVFQIIGQPTRRGVTWAWTRSDLDMADVPRASAQLFGFLDRAGTPGFLMLYLGADRFVDLRGLRLLLTVTASVRERGGELAIVAPPVCLRRMVQVVDVSDKLLLRSSPHDAARWVRRQQRTR